VLFIDGVTEMCNDAAEFFGVRGLEESSCPTGTWIPKR